MSSFDALARNHTDLSDEDLDYLQRLMSTWGVLSDLCFADLVLFTPVEGSDGERFVVLGQARPTTAQTFHLDVLVGRIVDEFERPMVARAWRRQEIVESDDVILGRGERARMQCVPVVRDGRTIAIVSRESPLQVGRRPGQLERIYVDTFQRFANMIVKGRFPYEEEISDKAPRIGDGSLVLDSERRVIFASPNAMNAMHRMGFLSNVIGARLEEIGIPGNLIKRSYETGRPALDEQEPRLNVTLLICCMPLINDDSVVDGALVLMRDVTDIRRLDRLLHSKDATIREIHHRVKNNLQTISSLLDLQSRRLDVGPARTALEEAHRRVRSIALVHEILSRDSSEQVAFNEIIEPLVRVAAQTALVADQHVEFDVEGDAGELEAAIATPLAVVLAEVLANAVEHAFPDGKTSNGERPRVLVTLDNDSRNLNLLVSDNGMGLPDDFSIHKTKSLGLSITRSLVVSQLQGSIEMRNENGCVVELSIPLRLAR